MNFSELDLDFEDIGSWPIPIKVASGVLLFLLILLGAYFFVYKDQQATLEASQGHEQRLFAEFVKKQKKASNLEAFKAQLDQMQQIFGQLLRQLPSKAEMPDLLVDISQTALATGIKVELFKPGSETLHDFYAEKPIQLKMIGRFHQFGAFVSGVASLPRIVILTMHDISISPSKDESEGLVLEGTAKTYRYVSEDELPDDDAGEKG